MDLESLFDITSVEGDRVSFESRVDKKVTVTLISGPNVDEVFFSQELDLKKTVRDLHNKKYVYPYSVSHSCLSSFNKSKIRFSCDEWSVEANIINGL
tara:strand:+ start:1818 stop:2108 length:291 start_codon:yes stop_codon:yes gene_type:complete